MMRSLTISFAVIFLLAICTATPVLGAYHLETENEPSWSSGIYNSFCESCDHFVITETGDVEQLESPKAPSSGNDMYDALVLAQLEERVLGDKDAKKEKKEKKETNNKDTKKTKKNGKIAYAPTLNCDCQFIPEEKSVWVPKISPIAVGSGSVRSAGGSALDKSKSSKNSKSGSSGSGSSGKSSPGGEKKEEKKKGSSSAGGASVGTGTAAASSKGSSKGGITPISFREKGLDDNSVAPHTRVTKLMQYNPERAALGSYPPQHGSFLQFNPRSKFLK